MKRGTRGKKGLWVDPFISLTTDISTHLVGCSVQGAFPEAMDVRATTAA
ncbi:MAG: hypothetical protein ABL983_09725 [Nitrospira sp.]